ncbi:hypothetical protein N8456_07340, partial [Porticoccaceae bacterium]|nr:hypothetical protein [Porticoccaceae bacterium]
KKVTVRVVGQDRVLSPAENTWDSFFAPGEAAYLDYLRGRTHCFSNSLSLTLRKGITTQQKNTSHYCGNPPQTVTNSWQQQFVCQLNYRPGHENREIPQICIIR